jgi:hypothetical protein
LRIARDGGGRQRRWHRIRRRTMPQHRHRRSR